MFSRKRYVVRGLSLPAGLRVDRVEVVRIDVDEHDEVPARGIPGAAGIPWTHWTRARTTRGAAAKSRRAERVARAEAETRGHISMPVSFARTDADY